MSAPENYRSIVEAMLRTAQDEMKSVEKRLLKIARVGIDDPTVLTQDEVKQVCLALVVHYHQLGIE
jgi:hypothetical protein